MKLYITRHGETEWNKAGKMQGWQNSNLTEKGLANAKALGEHLKHIDFDCIYSSPQGRALDTAMQIRGNKDTEVVIYEDLKEMGFGTWEGLDHEALSQDYPDEYQYFWKQPHLYKGVGGESYQTLIARVKAAIEGIVAENKGENILVVAHAAVIKAIYAIVKGLPLADFWSPPYMHGTCLSIIEVSDDGMSFSLEADISHLD